MKFLLNTWYMAAWADELDDGALLGRTIAGKKLVLFRDGTGKLQALDDRCPHRFAPLSTGRLVGDSVQCPYHGLQFNGDGKCTHNPHSETIPKAACVRSYIAEERHSVLWVWLGDQALAKESEIPDLGFFVAAPQHAKGKGYLPTAANYELLSDNIMDLSHVDYLHPTTLGGGALSRTKAEVEEIPGNKVRISWNAPNDVAPPAFAHYLEQPENSDVWAEVVWNPPGLMFLNSGAAPAGRPREEGPFTRNLHIMTPQDGQFTHYFFANTRLFEQDNAELNAFIQPMLLNVFANEDKPMVEAQQVQMGEGELLNMNPVLLTVDAGAIRCRRVLKRLIEEEQAAGA
ncbi:aromatic ring-hydroxylating dioxygenase subunit alpha [Pseudomonas sp. CC120222-01a]|uniref:aromatic ring-hydroxylating dioxygenase subunit alpha n=1 Tax=Pseudomonas sp. CC120222-01a TaxID=1378075 RepID=UPI000D9F810D|nr:aromatic ring-hydroxylating dioxygenase subunit alpha [Pseudomonas sp. CC120222-01a]PVZ42521.1 vanillate O-demethylase monooxygenase subunit [Pseudomonas sp. CC120222-01a]